jgi:hypothetical protein
VDKEAIEEFYYLTLLDLKAGVSIHELEDVIRLYEDIEDYEACAGILKAINETKYDTIENIKQRNNDRTN